MLIAMEFTKKEFDQTLKLPALEFYSLAPSP
jgi:hypothetical protein